MVMDPQRTTSSVLEIRTALPDDAAALSSLLSELGFPAAPEVVTERLRKLHSASERVLVATVAETVVGFVSLHVTPVLHRPVPVGRMTALAVAQEFRRQGIGKTLVAAAERALRSAGCGLIELTSNQKLTEAHAFYKRLGYEVTSYRFFKPL